MKNKLLPFLLALLCLFATSVRPAHASGTVAPAITYSATAFTATYSYVGTGSSAAVAANSACAKAGAGGTGYGTFNSGSTTTGKCYWSDGTYHSVYFTMGNSTSACPSNSTGTTTCTCNSGYEPNSGATACVVPSCPASGTTVSSGYYDLGTVSTAVIPGTACSSSGCRLEFEPYSFEASTTYYGATYYSVIDGITHYFSRGAYSAYKYDNGDGQGPTSTCTNGNGTSVPAPTAYSAMPPATCHAGQTLVTSSTSGKSKCYNDVTGKSVSTDSTAEVAATKAAADAGAAAAGAAAGSAAASAVAAAGGDAAAQTAASQSSAAAAAGAAAAAATMPDPCSDSSAVGCMSGGTDLVSDTGALTTKNITVGSIVPVNIGAAGSCPAPAAMVIHGQTYYFSYTTYCNYATGIKPILLVFAWLMAAGILVGSFKT